MKSSTVSSASSVRSSAGTKTVEFLVMVMTPGALASQTTRKERPLLRVERSRTAIDLYHIRLFTDNAWDRILQRAHPCFTETMRKSNLFSICFIIPLMMGCQKSTSPPPSGPSDDFIIIAPYMKQTAYKIYSDGAAEKIALSVYDHYRGVAGIGDQKPAASPDKSLIAYVDAGNLWFCHTQSGDREQITTFGIPQDNIYASIDILFCGWSKDGKLFLYALEPGENPIGALKIRELKEGYGFYVYETANKTHTKVELPSGEFGGWLNNEEILIVGDGADGEIRASSPLKKNLRTLPAPPGRHLQPSISADGRFLVAVYQNLSQLIRLNLSTGDFDYIFIGSQLEWPKLSPNNQHIACIQKISSGTRSQPPSRNVMIDTQLLFEYKGRYSIRVDWINDETVAVSLDREILAIDVSTKVIKARIPIH